MSTTWQEIFDLGSRDATPAETGPESEERRRGVFRRLRESLSKSRQALVEEISASLFDRIDEETWERLREGRVLAGGGGPPPARGGGGGGRFPAPASAPRPGRGGAGAGGGGSRAVPPPPTARRCASA